MRILESFSKEIADLTLIQDVDRYMVELIFSVSPNNSIFNPKNGIADLNSIKKQLDILAIIKDRMSFDIIVPSKESSDISFKKFFTIEAESLEYFDIGKKLIEILDEINKEERDIYIDDFFSHTWSGFLI